MKDLDSVLQDLVTKYDNQTDTGADNEQDDSESEVKEVENEETQPIQSDTESSSGQDKDDAVNELRTIAEDASGGDDKDSDSDVSESEGDDTDSDSESEDDPTEGDVEFDIGDNDDEGITEGDDSTDSEDDGGDTSEEFDDGDGEEDSDSSEGDSESSDSEEGDDEDSSEAEEGSGEEDTGSEEGGEESDEEDEFEEDSEEDSEVEGLSDPVPDEESEDSEGDSDEGDEESDPVFDSEGTLQEVHHAQASVDSSDKVEEAVSIIKESQAISDRLGELAELITSKHGVGEGSNTEEEKEEVESEESMTSLEAFAIKTLVTQASKLLNVSVEEIKEDPYRIASVRCLEELRESIKDTLNRVGDSRIKLSAKITSLKDHINHLPEEGKDQSVTLSGDQVANLTIHGSLNLEHLLFAAIYQTTTNELVSWIQGALAKYLQAFAKGQTGLINPFKPSTVSENKEIADRVNKDYQLASDCVSSVLPGNKVIATIEGKDEQSPIVKMVSLVTAEKTANELVINNPDKRLLLSLLKEIEIMADTVKRGAEVIKTLETGLGSLENWVADADDEEIRLIKLDHILPLAYSPALSLYSHSLTYTWSLVLVLEEILKQLNVE